MDVKAEREELFAGIEGGRCVEPLTPKMLRETIMHPLWGYVVLPVTLPFREITVMPDPQLVRGGEVIAFYPVRAEHV